MFPSGGTTDFAMFGALVTGFLGLVFGYVLGRHDKTTRDESHTRGGKQRTEYLPKNKTHKVPAKHDPDLASVKPSFVSGTAEPTKPFVDGDINRPRASLGKAEHRDTKSETDISSPSSTAGWSPADFANWCSTKMGPTPGQSIRWAITGELFEYPTGKLLATVIGVDMARRVVGDCVGDQTGDGTGDKENATSLTSTAGTVGTADNTTNQTQTVTQLSRKLMLFLDPTSKEIITTFAGRKVVPAAFPYQLVTYSLIDVGTGNTHTNLGNGNPDTGGDRTDTAGHHAEQANHHVSTSVTVGAGGEKITLTRDRSVSKHRGRDGVTTFSVPAFLDVQTKDGNKHEAYEAYDYFPGSSSCGDSSVVGNEKETQPSNRWTYTRFGVVHPFGEACVLKTAGYRVQSHSELPKQLQKFIHDNAPHFKDAPADLDEIRRLQR